MSLETVILTRRLMFLRLLDEVLDEYDELEASNTEARYRPGGKIDLSSLGDNQWLEQFRFTQSEIMDLVVVLDLPSIIKCQKTGVEEDNVTALCMLLRRLAYPTRLVDVELLFGWEKSRFSRITRLVAATLFSRWKHLLRFDPSRLTPAKLAEFGKVVMRKGAPLDCVVAFIDGTLQKNARPVHNQRLVYNGWKRIHCLKYHAVLSPDGLVIHVYGPVDGRRHDETVYRESGFEALLEKHFWTVDGQPLFVYGDAAYNVGPHILAPFQGSVITPEQQAFNAKMSRVREPVEWIFKEVTQQFTYLDFSRNQKILLTPCGLFYLVSILLCNAHTILHRPQIHQYFMCEPPSLREYFRGGPVDDDELEEWCLDSAWAEYDLEDSEQEDSEDSM